MEGQWPILAAECGAGLALHTTDGLGLHLDAGAHAILVEARVRTTLLPGSETVRPRLTAGLVLPALESHYAYMQSAWSPES